MHRRPLGGFTLLELLVVIAIIGILSSIVLASLNTARAKAHDAAIQLDIDSARNQAEVYYHSNNQDYSNVCSGTAADGTPGFSAMIAAATAQGGTVYCNSDADTWVVSSTLVTDPSQAWCADTSGTSTPRTGNPTSGTSC